MTPTIQARVEIGAGVYFADLEAGISIERTLGMSPNMLSVVIPGNYVPNLPGGYNFGPSSPLIMTGATASILIKDGLGNEITASNLTVHETYLSQSPQGGFRTTVALKDARWRNQRSSITGQYNQPGDAAYINSFGALVEGRLRNQRTVKQLVELCFAAMGLAGTDYNTTALDGIDWYPPVNWNFAIPAAEIESMLAEIGCGVAFRRDGKYYVVVLGDTAGQGVPPPYELANIPKHTSVAELDAANIFVVGGRIITEELSGFLEPVGVDVDGSIKPLRNLSYAPTPNFGSYGGFEKVLSGWGGFTLIAGVAGTSRLTRPAPPSGQPAYTDDFIKGLAEKSAWRMYRFNPSGNAGGEIYAAKLPWLPYIVQAEVRNGRTVRKEPVLYVQRTDPNGNTPFTDEPYEIISGDSSDLKYSIDFDTGIITFDERVYIKEWPSAIAARIKVRYAYESATYDNDPGQPPVKFVREVDSYTYPRLPTNGPGVDPPNLIPLPHGNSSVIPAGAVVIHRPELIQYNYKDDAGVESPLNLAELDAFAAQIVDMVLREDGEIVGGDGTFPRLIDMDVNGAFRQIIWSLNAGGARTTVVCNGERSFNRSKFLTYHEKISRVKIGRGQQEIDLLASPLGGPMIQPAPNRSGRESAATSPGQQATRGIAKAAFNATSPAESIPRFAFVEIVSSDADGACYSVKKPTGGAKVGGSIGVMTHGCAVNAFDDVILAGEGRVAVDAATASQVTVGTYVDPKPGTFVAQPGTGFLVLETSTVSGSKIARIRLPGREGTLRFRAKLTGWQQIGSIRKWKYAWSEGERNGDNYQVKSGGRTGTTSTNYALNLREGSNLADHAGTQGNSINEARPGFPPGYHLVPIGGGTGTGSGVCANETWVEMTVTTDVAGNTVYEFEATNSEDGTCS